MSMSIAFKEELSKKETYHIPKYPKRRRLSFLGNPCLAEKSLRFQKSVMRWREYKTKSEILTFDFCTSTNFRRAHVRWLFRSKAKGWGQQKGACYRCNYDLHCSLLCLWDNSRFGYYHEQKQMSEMRTIVHGHNCAQIPDNQRAHFKIRKSICGTGPPLHLRNFRKNDIIML